MSAAATERDAAARIAAQAQQLAARMHELDTLSDWEPARGLRAVCTDATARLREIGLAAERPLVVVILGGCGVGKSTLLNALAHDRGLSATGPARPTTNELIVYAARREDAAALEDAVGQGGVRVVTNASAAGLGHLVLVDTPDTNSVAAAAHRPVVERALGVADVLLCLFSAADNPKAADQLAYLTPFVAAFPKEYLYVGLTHVDRLASDERRAVAVDFEAHLATAWPRPPKATVALAAKAREAGVAADDDFDALETELRLVLGRIESPMAVRAARAEAVASAAETSFQTALEQARAATMLATRQLEQCALRQGRRLSEWFARPADDAKLVEEVARRFGGPFGVLLRLSRWRFRRLLWFANRQPKGDDSAPACRDLLGGLRLDVARSWPDIAARLREAGFAAEALVAPLALECVRRVEAEIDSAVTTAAARAHDSAVAWIVRPWRQVVLNLLFLAIPVAGLAQGLWTVFVRNQALPTAYLRNVAGLWFAGSLLLLGGMHWIGRATYRSAWRPQQLEAGPELLRNVPVVRQVHALLDLILERAVVLKTSEPRASGPTEQELSPQTEGQASGGCRR
jgi:energy-coupling factor transporter ATP-binding protein EcfA2